jgi:hypothetical protein
MISDVQVIDVQINKSFPAACVLTGGFFMYLKFAQKNPVNPAKSC